MATSRIKELSDQIATNTQIVNDYLAKHNLTFPSFSIGTPARLPIPPSETSIIKAQKAVILATEELRNLMLGPMQALRSDYTKNISIHFISRYEIARMFPPGDEISFEAIGTKIGLETALVARILRHGISVNGLFREVNVGAIQHNAWTEQMYHNEGLRDYFSAINEEFWPAAGATVKAIEQFPNSQENTETGYTVAHNTSDPMFKHLSNYPERAKKFAGLMSYMGGVSGYEPHHLLDNFDWESVKSVVDVGGSHGSIMISIAERFPHIKCYVQDLAKPVAEGAAKLPSHLKDRIEFMAHDFFTPQPITACVYYLRWIFHNWSTKYSISILRNLIPALRPGAKIVINEFVAPPAGTMELEEDRKLRRMDLCMLMLHNAQEREEKEWKELFQLADKRFKFVGARKPEGGALSIVEAVWEGGEGFLPVV